MSGAALAIICIFGIICVFTCIIFAATNGKCLDNIGERINHFRIKKIKKAYEKGNYLPLIKAAKTSRNLHRVYAYEFLELIPGYKESMKSVIVWWAEKLPEYLRLAYFTETDPEESPAKYILDRIYWGFLDNAEVRLSDEFLDEIFKDKEAFDWIEENVPEYEYFTQYLARHCYDNKHVIKLFTDKGISREEVS